ncbi:MAG: hypothetical protein ACO1QB_05015 [Verrucomicrobiales bacterium]
MLMLFTDMHKICATRWLAMLALLLGFSSNLLADPAKTNNNPAPAATNNTPTLKLKSVLIWGTDGDKPDDPSLKDLDEEVKKKLRKIFKWKEYHLVRVQNLHLAPGEKKKIELSSKCTVEGENKIGEGLEVKLHGEGKLVKKVKQAMPLTEWLVLGGDDKDSNAWFVLIMPESDAPSLKETK